MTKREWERRYPYIGGLAGPGVAVLVVSGGGYNATSEQLSAALVGAGTLGGVMVGFLATALAILFALPDRSAVQYLAKMGGLQNIIAYLSEAIYGWLAVTLASLVAGFVLPVLDSVSAYAALLIWSYLGLMALLAFYRAVTLVGDTLRLVADDAKAKVS